MLRCSLHNKGKHKARSDHASIMKIEKIKINKIKEYGNNPRVHSERQIEQIKNSIENFGFKVPILLDEDLTIIAGHGRFEAAKSLELKQVPSIICKDLSVDKANALRILDNQIALNSSWNEMALLEEISKINFSSLALEDFDFPKLEGDEKLREMFREAEEGRLDIAESILMKQIKKGNTTALIFFLKTKGRQRGYVEKQELSHSVDDGDREYFKNMYRE